MPLSETLFIVGESRTNLDNAITKMYGSFYIAFEVEPSTGEIIDFDCTKTIEVTQRFLSKIFIGKSLEKDYTAIEEEISRRYFGSSLKAVLVSFRDAHKRYLETKSKIDIK
ncbi:MAG: DUF3870 domain-containing protein [Oscillospiraceae bacterium]